MRKVKVLPYKVEWKERFISEKADLKKVLPKDSIIHHIGSTSVEGLAAKPIIDILVEVHSLKEVDGISSSFLTLGFIGKGENGIPNRRYFYKDESGQRTVHLHIFTKGSYEVTRHIAFRDFLRSHKTEAEKYGELKLKLSKQYPSDMESYIQGKDEFVKELEKRAVNWYTINKSE